MITTEWLTPEYGLAMNVKQIAWTTEEVDASRALSDDTEGRLLVTKVDDVRISWSPISYAEFSALEAVINSPAFETVYEGITENATRRDNTDDDEETVEDIQDILDQLQELDELEDIMDEDDHPSPYTPQPSPPQDERDFYGPHWTVTKRKDTRVRFIETTTTNHDTDLQHSAQQTVSEDRLSTGILDSYQTDRTTNTQQ